MRKLITFSLIAVAISLLIALVVTSVPGITGPQAAGRVGEAAGVALGLGALVIFVRWLMKKDQANTKTK